MLERISAAAATMLCLALPGAALARPASPVRVAVPHELPGEVASAAATATWLVGAAPGRETAAIARRHGARLLTARGTYVIARGRARAFATALRAAGRYRFAEPDRPVKPLQAPAGGDEFGATDWRAAMLGGLPAPAPGGAPLSAVIDSAIDTTHPELAGVRTAGETAVTELHGTAVASVLGGRANGAGMVGIFPGAPILALGTSLSTSDLTRAVAASVEAGAKVVNMSLGGPVPSFALFVEIAYAASEDVVVVAAAGNDFGTVLPDGTTNPVMFPAAFPHVMSVSSIGPSGASSDFSTANGAVDVAAPGESVLAAVPVALDPDGTPDGFARLDGTSFSAPIVSGALAWIRTARPDLSGFQAADLLRFTARDVPPAGFDDDSGFGLIDVGAALAGEEPPQDTLEVNDDVEWVDGRRFNRPDPLFAKPGSGRRFLGANVDLWKDPADVYRFKIGPRARLVFKLRTAPGSDPDLAIFNRRARTIYKRRGLVGSSGRGPGRAETVRVRNPGRSAVVGYVAVYAPGPRAPRLDAPYVLTVTPRR